MKKALIVLLLLAFVAGGLFAQFSFAGRVDSGLAIFKSSATDSKVSYGSIAKQTDAGAVTRGEVDFNATKEGGQAGIVIRLRVDAVNMADGSAFNLRHAYGWLKVLDGLLEVRGGRFSGTNYDTFDALSDGASLCGGSGNAYGFQTYIKPIDILSFGVGAKYNTTRQGLAVNGPTFKDNFAGWFGLGLAMPDLMGLNVQMDFGRDNVNFQFSWRLLAVKNLTVIVTGRFLDLTEFSDVGQMWFYEQFGFTGIKNLTLGLGLVEALNKAPANDAFYFSGVVWAAYALNGGKIIPRLDVAFGVNGPYTINDFYFNNFIAGAGSFLDKDRPDNSNMGFITFTPSVKFQVMNNCFFDVGFFGGIDIGDVSAFHTAAPTTDTGFNWGIFTSLYVRF